MLIHQLPPKPDYLRVKIGRRLQRIGAIAIKNTVYVLPDTDSALEDLQWTAREIRTAGGEANISRGSFIDGLTDGEIQQRFNTARDGDYKPLLAEARKLRRLKGATTSPLRERAAAIKAVDYFGASSGQHLEAILNDIDRDQRRPLQPQRRNDVRGKVWVTRAGLHVDRMASAWLIQRFIDPKARFRFVVANSYKPKKNEVRFDMFEAEFTHEGDRCTFEVLLERMGIDDRALQKIGEVVHDIDLRDEKFGRPETAGIAMLVNGIALGHRDEEERLRRGMEVFDELYRTYGRK